MKLLARLLALAASVLIASPVAFADNSTSLSTMNADSASFCLGALGTLAQNNNGCVGTFKPMGVVFTTTASAATTQTTQQTLASYSLPANALDIAGRRVHVRGMFSTAANTNSKTCGLYFGSESVTATTTTSAATMAFDIDVVKTGASTQIVWTDGLNATTPVAAAVTAATETDTSAITIAAKCTTGTSSGDATLQDLAVEYMN